MPDLAEDLATPALVGLSVVLGRTGVAAGLLVNDREIDDPVWRIANSIVERRREEFLTHSWSQPACHLGRQEGV